MITTIGLPHVKLMFELKNPSLEDCWAEGYDQSKTATLQDNPYKKGTVNYNYWIEGWWSGFYENSSNNDEYFEDESASELFFRKNQTSKITKKQFKITQQNRLTALIQLKEFFKRKVG